jgi:glycosyltransferase involved in cell wall biosynthesis
MMPSETFGIVNIEAMLMGLPIVTFGTFGQGEYLTVPWEEERGGGGEEEGYDDDLGYEAAGRGRRGSAGIDAEDTTVTRNAVVVTRPTSESLSEAVLLLLRNATERRERGMAARMTVLKGYTSQHHSGYGFYDAYREIMTLSSSPS